MKLSIIVPVYNCKEYLDECLMSIYEQMDSECELIAVDDGSADGTTDMLDSYKNRDNLSVIYCEHKGASHARNAGLDNAKGEYVTFLDCDDTYCDGFLSKSLPLIDEKYDLYLFGFIRRFYNGESVINALDNHKYEDVSSFADAYIRRGRMLFYSACNKFYRRDVIKRFDIRFEESYGFGEDRLFNFSYIRHIDNIYTTDLIMFNYNQRSLESMSTKTIPNYFNLAKMLHEEIVKCFLELSKGTTIKERKDFVNKDLVKEINMTIDRFKDHPNEMEDNLPMIYELIYGNDNDRSYNEEELREIVIRPDMWRHKPYDNPNIKKYLDVLH